MNPCGNLKTVCKPKCDPFELEETTLVSSVPKRGFQETIDFLNDLGVGYRVISEYHIKIDWINYYPTKRTIYKDQAISRYKGRGLDFLKQVLIKEGILRKS